MKSLLSNKPLLVILLIAFLMRIVLLAVISVKNPEGIYVFDSYGYWNLGYNIFHNGIFSQSADVPLDPDYYRTPVYPLFIAFAEFFGPEGYSIIILQIIVSLLSCYFTFRLAKLITENVFIANAAALLVAVDLPSVALSNLVLTETFFTFLMIMTFYFFVRFLKKDAWKDLFLSALLGGLLILCRPIAFFLPVLFLVFLTYSDYKNIRKAITKCLSYSLIVFVTLSPWLVRNKRTFGHYFISVIREHNMLNYQAGSVYAERFKRSLPESQSILRWKTFREFKGNAYQQPYEYASFIEKEALKVITDYPGIFLKQQAMQVFYFFLKPTCAYFEIQFGHWGKGYNSIPRRYRLSNAIFKGTGKITMSLVLFQIILLVIMYAGFVTGIIYLRKRKEGMILTLLMLTIACFALMNLPPATEARFRVPVIPLISIVSACGLYYVKEKYFLRKKKEEILPVN